MSNREIKFRIKSEWDGEWQYFNWDYSESWSSDLSNCKKETLGQYTGVKDSNEKEIYEGDIVQFLTQERNGVVGYDEPQFCVINLAKKEAYPLVGKACVVIGNIYDNKNFLQNEKSGD